MMKKTLLAVAITALSANTFAASIDYTAPLPVVNSIAQETAAASNIAITTADTLTWKVSFATTTSSAIRIDLTNGAKFTNAPELKIDTVIATVVAGGAGQTFAVFQATGAKPADVNAVLTFANLTAATQANIDAGYKLYLNPSDALANNASTVTTGSFAYAKFAPGLTFAATATANTVSKQIDVTSSGKKFVNGTLSSAAFGGLNLAAVANSYAPTNLGAALSLTDLIGTTAELTVSGDFTAAAAVAAGTTLASLTPKATTGLNDAKNAVIFPMAAAPLAINDGKLIYAVTGNTAMTPSSYNVSLKLGTAAKMLAAPSDVSGIANLGKNGATTTADLALKPGGAYSNFVRITNSSAVAGNIFITVFNDAGESKTVNLSDVAGQTSNAIPAGGSTTQMSIQDIFNAAAAKGLAPSGEGKLRLVVDGEVSENKLSVQTYTISKDGNSFATF